MKNFIAAMAAAAVLSLSSCAALAPDNMVPVAGQDDHYVVLKRKDNNVVSVTNDDHAMFVEFGYKVSDTVAFFDSDGKRLKFIRHNDVACVLGLHREVLVRDGNKVSFISVPEGIALKDGPRVSENPTIKKLQATTRARMAARAKMKRAMQLSNGAVAQAPATPTPEMRMAAAVAAADGKGASADKIPVVTSVVTVSPKPGTMDWTAQTPDGLPASVLNTSSAKGYITFIDGSLQPVKAAPVVDGIRELSDAGTGTVLVSGIAPGNATDAQVDLALRRAEFIKAILVQEGVDQSKVTLTAVFRSDSARRKDPARPGETVSVKWLGSSAPAKKGLQARK